MFDRSLSSNTGVTSYRLRELIVYPQLEQLPQGPGLAADPRPAASPAVITDRSGPGRRKDGPAGAGPRLTARERGRPLFGQVNQF
jgi:hypothetical protein